MELMNEAGVAGLGIVLVFFAGLVATMTGGRARGAPVATAVPFVLGTLALGQLGQGLGQRNVRAVLDHIPDLADRVTVLNEGTGEAAANLVLAGEAAAVLLLVAAALALADRRA